jgi:hypothetical protein
MLDPIHAMGGQGVPQVLVLGDLRDWLVTEGETSRASRQHSTLAQAKFHPVAAGPIIADINEMLGGVDIIAQDANVVAEQDEWGISTRHCTIQDHSEVVDENIEEGGGQHRALKDTTLTQDILFGWENAAIHHKSRTTFTHHQIVQDTQVGRGTSLGL